MKDLYPLIWAGRFHYLRVARHWSVFWSLTGLCEFNRPRMVTLLEPGLSHRLCYTYRVVSAARDYIDTFDSWWTWSQKLCDDFADSYVSGRPRTGNDFWDITGTYLTAEGVAKISASRVAGFRGPQEWAYGR